MFWDKKDSKLPDLPPSQTKPNFNNSVDDSEPHELPSFPDSPTQKGFSQTAIKDAIEPEHQNTQLSTKEMEEWSPKIPEAPAEENTISPPSFPKSSFEEHFTSSQNTNSQKDIYVKLDKFTAAKKAISQIKQDLKDMDELLRRIRETKMREEQELSGWEKEIYSIKERIDKITENIFKKI